MDDASLRADMIEGLEHQIGEPIEPPVLTALQRVPRDPFVDDSPRGGAVDGDDPHSLSLATLVRLVTALDAEEGDSVLVVGAGIGYSVAILAEIAGARRVHAIDIDRSAVVAARSNLDAAGHEAVLVDRADGADGLPAYAPYDRILLEAAVVEPPRALREQLASDGRIVYPRGAGVQTIAAIEPSSTATSGAPAAPPTNDGADDDPAPAGFETVETHGPARLRPMLADGEQPGVERNRTRREDAERAERGRRRRHGWEQDWIDWDDRL
ncbi:MULTISPECIES: protein-L-isoaspartate O-methyltransferase family protein [Halorubrum]|uniref:protein-L-isoaspartate(D-aspartate) O-methyltransferase n=1 Tax=Halorubrum sodomense TaxID=35743 RepID=A0A1I6G0L1_HALSD|nr:MULTISPECIES: methyltransferase [Halorubrum]TKX53971.1 protein-L-isoaspartate O-methyltransferase [Halorubrum sp. SP3]TKX70008.1 protein-L-isoaspartate O-methyltransferase [Halorubrum sp. SP9]SFR35680.1 protein-L-isoaspartate(D-aspartate) O-methyltransferase [Halorubrum sodomense]